MKLNIPKMGYKKSTNCANPILIVNREVIQIKIANFLYCFLFFVQFCKNPYPADIAEVKIADMITPPKNILI